MCKYDNLQLWLGIRTQFIKTTLKCEITKSLLRSQDSLGMTTHFLCDTVQNPHFFPGSTGTEPQPALTSSRRERTCNLKLLSSHISPVVNPNWIVRLLERSFVAVNIIYSSPSRKKKPLMSKSTSRVEESKLSSLFSREGMWI